MSANAGPDPQVKAMFWSCDGYGVPSRAADGMTSSVVLWSTRPTDNMTAKADQSRGRQGVEACTAALADDHLLPGHWRRKVNLLEARALHRLESGDPRGAIADLDLADTAILDPKDIFFARSQGISLGYMRAYALGLLGDQAGAETLALRYLALRPYSREAQFATLAAMGEGADAKLLESLERTVARLQPQTIDDIYKRMILEGRWPEVISLYNQLVTPKVIRRTMSGGVQEDREFVDTRVSNAFWVDRTGPYAYALATLGRGSEARAALQAVKARLQAALASDPVNEASRWVMDEATGTIKAQDSLADRDLAQLDRWSDLVELRIGVDQGRAADVATALLESPPPADAIGRDLVTALAARLGAAPGTSPEALKAIAALAPPPAAKPSPPPGRRNDIITLILALPVPEVPERMPRYSEAAPGRLFYATEAGFSVAPAYAEFTDLYGKGVVDVEFRSLDTNPQVSEEMALLRAADMALQAGKSGLVVLARRDIQHTLNIKDRGLPSRSLPNGYSTILTVVFVDAASPPDRLKGAEWRIIDARAVYDALAPVYLGAGTQKPARKS